MKKYLFNQNGLVLAQIDHGDLTTRIEIDYLDMKRQVSFVLRTVPVFATFRKLLPMDFVIADLLYKEFVVQTTDFDSFAAKKLVDTVLICYEQALPLLACADQYLDRHNPATFVTNVSGSALLNSYQQTEMRYETFYEKSWETLKPLLPPVLH